MEGRLSRQLLALGERGQRVISAARVGIVGLGGMGSQVVQALAYLGVGRFVLVDHDQVELSNLNRLVGASPADIGRWKVDVAERTVLQIQPGASCQLVPGNLRSERAMEALRATNAVFGCVDQDGARLVLMEFCCAYSITYIDAASEIILDPTGTRIDDFGGRVVVSRPGDFCLVCASELDPETAKADLEPERIKAAREAHGYGLGHSDPSPAVVSLNGIVANLAVTEFLVLTTGIREPYRKSTYKGMRGIVQVSRDVRRADCYNCGYLVGKGDAADLSRYWL